ncbi:MAG: DNA repair protein RecN [Candidatus Melainabacteria bacterium]|nr:MAG: DNA repair protein RecN [Candidatus Melainabacteria bacterium]
MIKSIHVKNYILIEDLTVNFDNGLNVITGETGAGKSILINAIDIAFGAKPAKDVVKKGAEKALIELFIESKNPNIKTLFEENGIDTLDEIILSREITSTSSRTRVNGTLVNQEFIKSLKEMLIDIHSQHQTYAFLQPKSHIILLDNYAKDLYGEELQEYKCLYKEYQGLLNALETAQNSANATESQIDFLKFQINEIEQANIEDVTEEETLQNELSVLENSEKLQELTQTSYWALNGDEGSLIDALLQIKANISKAVDMDNSLEGAEQSIIEISELTRDLSSTLRDYYQSVNSDTARLNEVQERLYLFDKLKRKYGSTLEEVIQTYDKLSEELNTIEFSSKNVEEIQAKIDEILMKLNKLAQDISAKRKNYAQVLSSLIVDELEKLELAKSRFEIRITPKELSSDGIDDVEFYISTNVSQDLSPLAKTASGGEISRVMLAIKTIFAKSDEIDTVIFDEIDTGISGKAAQSVADEISELAKFRQIIVITHQAIIAVKADKHFLVSKEQGEETEVTIKALNEDEKVKAIASLASGDNSESALDFAKSLLSAK